MSVAITAIGTASPVHRQSQKSVIDLMCATLQLTPVEKRMLRAVYNASGIDYRHSVLEDFSKPHGELTFFPNDVTKPFPTTAQRMKAYKQHALPLALRAIENCFSNLSFDQQQITHLVTVSCTGMYAPGIDIEIIHALGLKSNIQRTAVNFMGCYGSFNGIKVAHAICQANPSAKVLVVSVELCTLHFQKNFTPDNLIAGAIFADGAAAALIESNSKKKHFSLEQFHCDLLPQASKEMAWEIADSGFDMVLTSYVPQTVESGIAAFAEKLLSLQQLKITDVDHYAIHPGGVKILEACEQSLNLSQEQNVHAYEVLRQNGNMSSATILFVLKSLWDSVSQEHDGQTIFSCAFGPGLTLESMLLKISS